MTIAPNVPAEWQLGEGFVPKGRYPDRSFLQLEYDRLFSQVGSSEQSEAYKAFLEERNPTWSHDDSREGFVLSRRNAWCAECEEVAPE